MRAFLLAVLLAAPSIGCGSKQAARGVDRRRRRRDWRRVRKQRARWQWWLTGTTGAGGGADAAGGGAGAAGAGGGAGVAVACHGGGQGGTATGGATACTSNPADYAYPFQDPCRPIEDRIPICWRSSRSTRSSRCSAKTSRRSRAWACRGFTTFTEGIHGIGWSDNGTGSVSSTDGHAIPAGVRPGRGLGSRGA